LHTAFSGITHGRFNTAPDAIPKIVKGMLGPLLVQPSLEFLRSFKQSFGAFVPVLTGGSHSRDHVVVSFFSKSFHRGAAAAVEGLTRLMKTRWCFYV
jgi:hypothetical protein